MGIWGKIVGGAIGFGFGGPMGALLGALAGHIAVDKRAADAREREAHERRLAAGHGAEERRYAFAVAVVALSAKLAKADGRVSRDEVAAIKSVFRIPASESAAVAAIFNEARREAAGFEPYAEQIAEIFAGRRELLEELLGALLMVAHADGVYHPEERRLLERAAAIFGFGEAAFRRIEATFTRSIARDEGDPYEVLGLTADAGDAEVKAAHRRLVRENHPDRLAAQGLPEDFVEVANKKMAEVNAAWDRIKKARGLN